MANLVEDFNTRISKAEFTFIVYYRGSWCPFCISYLKDLKSLTPSIEAANGQIIAITAEPEVKLPVMRKATGYDGTVIVDTTHAIATELRQRGLLNVAICQKSGYQDGMAQPAVLVLKKVSKVLFQWAIVPGTMNLGGAKDRPILKEVWDNVAAGLRGQPNVHENISKTSFIGMVWGKVFGS